MKGVSQLGGCYYSGMRQVTEVWETQQERTEFISVEVNTCQWSQQQTSIKWQLSWNYTPYIGGSLFWL